MGTRHSKPPAKQVLGAGTTGDLANVRNEIGKLFSTNTLTTESSSRASLHRSQGCDRLVSNSSHQEEMRTTSMSMDGTSGSPESGLFLRRAHQQHHQERQTRQPHRQQGGRSQPPKRPSTSCNSASSRTTLVSAFAASLSRKGVLFNGSSTGASIALQSGGIHDSENPGASMHHMKRIRHPSPDAKKPHRFGAAGSTSNKKTPVTAVSAAMTTSAPVKCPPRNRRQTWHPYCTRSGSGRVHPHAYEDGPESCGNGDYDENDVEDLQRIYDMRTWDMYFRITQARKNQAIHGSNQDDHCDEGDPTDGPPFFPLYDGRTDHQQHLACSLMSPVSMSSPEEDPNHTMIFGDLD